MLTQAVSRPHSIHIVAAAFGIFRDRAFACDTRFKKYCRFFVDAPCSLSWNETEKQQRNVSFFIHMLIIFKRGLHRHRSRVYCPMNDWFAKINETIWSGDDGLVRKTVDEFTKAEQWKNFEWAQRKNVATIVIKEFSFLRKREWQFVAKTAATTQKRKEN